MDCGGGGGGDKVIMVLAKEDINKDQQGNSSEERMLFDFAILSGDLKRANSVLEVIPPADREWLLRDHQIRGIPLLHHLAATGKPFLEESASSEEGLNLNRLVDFCVESGYKIDKLGICVVPQSCCTAAAAAADDKLNNKPKSKKLILSTALLGAILTGGGALAEALIRVGKANPNFPDRMGRTPTRGAISMNNLKVLQVLVEHGADLSSTPEEIAGGANNTHPPLHTAIERKRKEMASFLISNSLVDINEVAKYTSSSSSYFYHTPLTCAVKAKEYEVIEQLLARKNVRLNGFRELDYSFEHGDHGLVYLLLDRFTVEQLRSRKHLEWTLAHMRPQTTSSPSGGDHYQKESTRQILAIMSKCVRAGWDINTLGSSSRGYSILHAAVSIQDEDLMRGVVELGANVNLLSRRAGSVEAQLSPLHLAICLNNPDLVDYLMDKGSCSELEGRVSDPNSRFGFTRVVRARLAEDPLRFEKFNAVELVLERARSMKVSSGLWAKLLSKGVVWHGADELFVAVHGGDLELVKQVFGSVREQLGGAEDFQWISVGDWEWEASSSSATGQRQLQQRLRRKSLFAHLVERQCAIMRGRGVEWTHGSQCRFPEEGRGGAILLALLVELLEAFISRGYDVSLAEEGGESQLFAVLRFTVNHDPECRLLAKFLESGSGILETNVRSQRGETPVEFILNVFNWMGRNVYYCGCEGASQELPECVTILKLLLQHGVDVSTLVIGAGTTKFHFGYGAVIKALCRAGAKVNNNSDFFDDPLCHVILSDGEPNVGNALEDVEELKEWLATEGEENRLNLKMLCRVVIRSCLRRFGDVQKVPLPPTLKEYVAMKNDI